MKKMITNQLYEAQLQQIFKMLLENKTNEQIATELKINVRTVQNYKQRLNNAVETIRYRRQIILCFLNVSCSKIEC